MKRLASLLWLRSNFYAICLPFFLCMLCCAYLHADGPTDGDSYRFEGLLRNYRMHRQSNLPSRQEVVGIGERSIICMQDVLGILQEGNCSKQLPPDIMEHPSAFKNWIDKTMPSHERIGLLLRQQSWIRSVTVGFEKGSADTGVSTIAEANRIAIVWRVSEGKCLVAMLSQGFEFSSYTVWPYDVPRSNRVGSLYTIIERTDETSACDCFFTRSLNMRSSGYSPTGIQVYHQFRKQPPHDKGTEYELKEGFAKDSVVFRLPIE